jgi:hypothetical protein
MDINRACKNIRQNIKTPTKENLDHFELKKHKPWFDKGSSKLLDQKKQARFQWLQDPSRIIGDNMDNDVKEAGISGIEE